MIFFILQRIRSRRIAKSKVLYPAKKRSKLLVVYRFFVFLVFTAVTQIGGLIYLITLLITKKLTRNRFLFRSLIFLSLYLTATYIVTPKIAPFFGREKIKTTDYVQAHSSFYSWSNRNYVSAELHGVLQKIGDKLNQHHPGIKLVYLDANFPFINGFPLLPHRYHGDGKKIDITFVYEDGTKLTNLKPSFSGYGIFEAPFIDERNQINTCLENGYGQYDFTKYVTLGSTNPHLRFSETANKNFLQDLLDEEDVNTIFIEPHLKDRLGLENEKFIYHGCGTVRHDDHIHIEVK